MSTEIRSQSAAEPVGAYSHARKAGGLLLLAGIGPRRRGSKDIPGIVLDAAGRVIDYDFAAQVHSCFENVRTVLVESGSSWDQIVDVTVYLTNMPRDFAVYNRLWGEYFPSDRPLPARTTVEVSRLPQAGTAPIAFEVKVVAALAGSVG